MSWWLFLLLLRQVGALEARALLRAIDGPAMALNRLSEDGALEFHFLREQLKALT